MQRAIISLVALVSTIHGFALPLQNTNIGESDLSTLSVRDKAASVRLSSMVDYANEQGHNFTWSPVELNDGTGAVTAQVTTLSDEEWQIYESGLRRRANPDDFTPAVEARDTRYNTLAARESFFNKARCYGSGTWVKTGVVGTAAGTACTGFQYLVFGGSTQIIQVLNVEGQQLQDTHGRPLNMYFAFMTVANQYHAGLVTKSLCATTVSWLVEKGCSGDNS